MPDTKSEEVAVQSPTGMTKTDVGVSVSSITASPKGATAAPRKAGKLDVLVQGVALFSDGYNIQIIGYMNTVLAKL